MKKILFAFVALSFCMGCSYYPYKVESASVDYVRYSEAGFFITESNSVSFDYEPVGNVIVTIQSGYEILGTDKRGYHQYGKELIYADVYDVLDKVKSECEALGGNGIINLSIRVESALPATIWASGMAIKR